MKKILITAAAAALFAGSAFAGTAPTQFEAPVKNDDDFAAVPVAPSVSTPVIAGVAALVVLAALAASGDDDDDDDDDTTGTGSTGGTGSD